MVKHSNMSVGSLRGYGSLARPRAQLDACLIHVQLDNLLQKLVTLWDFIKSPSSLRQACHTPAGHSRASCQASVKAGPWKSTPAKGEVPSPHLTNASHGMGPRGPPNAPRYVGGQGDGVEHLLRGPFPGAGRIPGAHLPLCSELPSHLLAGTATLRLSTGRVWSPHGPRSLPSPPNNPAAFSREFMFLIQQYKQHRPN